jgi:TolB-like protein
MLLKALANAREAGDPKPVPARDTPSLPPKRTKLPAAVLVSVVFATVLGIWLWQERELSESGQDQSIAVLPFIDLSSGRDQQHFGDGIAEEILDELTGLAGLRVVARTSSFAFRDNREDLRAIAEALGATTILDGSIRRSGERIRITAQLINAADGFHLWYAAAWAALGLATASTMWQSAPEAAPQIIAEAIEHLLRAVQLEPNSAYAYSLLGTVNYARMDWAQSEEYFQQSLAISPDQEAMGHYGNMLMRSGRSSTAINVFESANQPANFLSRNAYLALGTLDGISNQALSPLVRYMAEYPSAMNLKKQSEVLQAVTGSSREGIAWKKFVESLPEEPADENEILSVLKETLQDPNASWPSKYNDIGLLAAFFGDPELALEAVAFESRLTTIRLFSLWFPVMRDVRRLAGFKELMEDINLPEYWRLYGWPDHCRPIGESDFDCS